MDPNLQRYVRINVFLARTVLSLIALTTLLLLTSGVALLGQFDLQIFGRSPLFISGNSAILAFAAAILGYLNSREAENDGYLIWDSLILRSKSESYGEIRGRK